jgi:hypothetical protein
MFDCDARSHIGSMERPRAGDPLRHLSDPLLVLECEL